MLDIKQLLDEVEHDIMIIQTEVCVICLSRRLRQITQICGRYCIYHVKFTSYCELIECSRPIRFFIVSLEYNKIYILIMRCMDLCGT